MDPLTLTGGAIAKLAFDEFIKSGAGEVAKKTVGGAIEQLRSVIKARFQGKNQKAEAAIAQVEQEGSPAALTKLEVYLDDAMAEDPTFAHEIRQMAQQIINIEHQTVEGNRIYNQTAGRDIFNVEKIEGGSNKFGGS